MWRWAYTHTPRYDLLVFWCPSTNKIDGALRLTGGVQQQGFVVVQALDPMRNVGGGIFYGLRGNTTEATKKGGSELRIGSGG
jgi:hypothetical protein